MVSPQVVRQRVEPHLLEIPGITGISHEGTGSKIVIYVESEDLIQAMPQSLSGIPVEVRVTGRIFAQQAVAQREKVRPLIGGVSAFVCCPYAAGTLGIVTYDGFILSNAHVFALREDFGYYSDGAKVIQPAVLDGGSEEDVVGYLHSYVPIKFMDVNAPNFTDAAIAVPSVDYEPGKILGIGKVDGWREPRVGDEVKKSGRTTGVTSSTVTDVGATVKVWYSYDRWAVFRDVIICEVFSSPGDSGSVVVSGDKVVGLLFAGSERVTVVSNIKYVIRSLGIRLGEEEIALPPDLKVVLSFVPVMAVGAIMMRKE